MAREDYTPQYVNSSLLRQCLSDMHTMLCTAEEMFEAATTCLLDNEPLEMDLRARDQEINEGENRIRRSVLEHMVMSPKQDLVFSLVLVSVVQDVERVGDLAKSLARTSQLATGYRMGPHVQTLRDLRDRVRAMFPLTRDGFLDSDEAAAKQVMETHDQVKKDVTNFLVGLAESEEDSVNQAVVLTLAAQLMGRVSGHLSNLLSAIVMPYDQLRNAPDWATKA